MENSANHPVRTTQKSLRLIEELKDQDGARIHELAEEVDLSKGGIHNHLSTLRSEGYVRKEGDEYRLSLQTLTLGGYIRSQSRLFQCGRPKADQLADDTGMLTNLMVEEEGMGVYLYRAKGNYAVSLDTHVGCRNHLHNIGLGKSILAHLERERVDEIIDRYGLPTTTEKTISERSELMEELETVRERGFAMDHEERTEGLSCIASPILCDEELLGAISIAAPVSRVATEGFDDQIISEVKSAANEIALDVKYR